MTTLVSKAFRWFGRLRRPTYCPQLIAPMPISKYRRTAHTPYTERSWVSYLLQRNLNSGFQSLSVVWATLATNISQDGSMLGTKVFRQRSFDDLSFDTPHRTVQRNTSIPLKRNRDVVWGKVRSFSHIAGSKQKSKLADRKNCPLICILRRKLGPQVSNWGHRYQKAALTASNRTV
jgi:hypothetical protein